MGFVKLDHRQTFVAVECDVGSVQLRARRREDEKQREKREQKSKS